MEREDAKDLTLSILVFVRANAEKAVAMGILLKK